MGKGLRLQPAQQACSLECTDYSAQLHITSIRFTHSSTTAHVLLHFSANITPLQCKYYSTTVHTLVHYSTVQTCVDWVNIKLPLPPAAAAPQLFTWLTDQGHQTAGSNLTTDCWQQSYTRLLAAILHQTAVRYFTPDCRQQSYTRLLASI